MKLSNRPNRPNGTIKLRGKHNSKAQADVSLALTAKEMQMERELREFEVVILVGGPESGKYFHTELGQPKFVDDRHTTYKIGKCLYRPIGAIGSILRLEFY